LGCDRNRPIQMRQRALEILRGASDAGGEKVRGGIARPFCKTCLEVTMGRLSFTFEKQHGGKKMIQHGIAGLAGQTLFTEPARLIGPPGIKGCRGTTNNVLGIVLVHAKHIRR